MQNKTVHFIGIKGVGMAALALIFAKRGFTVTGSDTGESFVTDDILNHPNITLYNSFSPSHISDSISQVIYSGAYNEDNNSEVKQAISIGIPLHTQQVALAELTSKKDLIAVAGVGGKTTTSAMIAHILTHATKDSGHFIGAGSVPTLKSTGKWGSGSLFVAEADEYANIAGIDQTPKLLLLNPKYPVITNIMHDHPDIYASEQDTLDTFLEFMNKTPSDGALFVNLDDPLTRQLLPKLNPDIQVITYSLGNDEADVSGKIFANPGENSTLSVQDTEIKLNTIGTHNARNSLAAIAIAKHLDLPWDSLSSFKGVGRRQELRGEVGDVLFYDDYAHHPNEIQLTIEAFKAHFQDRRIWVIFESHTFTRTQTLFDEFTTALAASDRVTIMPIFSSAREDRSQFNLTRDDLVADINKKGGVADSHTFNSIYEIASEIESQDIILTMGAGFVYKIHDLLQEEYAKIL